MPKRRCTIVMLTVGAVSVRPIWWSMSASRSSTAKLNRLDHLTDIGLSYERESGITEDECLQLSGRTLDWLA
jgi:hypothetical protein